MIHISLACYRFFVRIRKRIRPGIEANVLIQMTNLGQTELVQDSISQTFVHVARLCETVANPDNIRHLSESF